jgi:hypothetical protein
MRERELLVYVFRGDFQRETGLRQADCAGILHGLDVMAGIPVSGMSPFYFGLVSFCTDNALKMCQR